MSKPISLADIGLREAWKVRIIMQGGTVHVLSATEPQMRGDNIVEYTPITGTDYGDTVGFIDWTTVTAVTWRKAASPVAL